MRRQAERWGAELFQEDVESIDVKNNPFTIQSSEREVCALFANLPAFFSFCSFHRGHIFNILQFGSFEQKVPTTYKITGFGLNGLDILLNSAIMWFVLNHCC